MAPVRRVHQVFFCFHPDGRTLEDSPTFVASRDAFAAMDGWEYRRWDEEAVDGLIDVYHRLRYPVQRVDVAKYAIADAHGGVVYDIVVSPCTFDRCSRRNVLANDFLYIETGLVGIFEDFAANLARVEAIPVYTHWKMHYVFQTTGPIFYSVFEARRPGSQRPAPLCALLPRPQAEAPRGCSSRWRLCTTSAGCRRFATPELVARARGSAQRGVLALRAGHRQLAESASLSAADGDCAGQRRSDRRPHFVVFGVEAIRYACRPLQELRIVVGFWW